MPVVQVLLDGATIPKYVEPLPVLNANRVSGSTPVVVDMVEFQQRILPATFYATLAAPYNAGTYQWGYAVNGTAPTWPSRTIEAQRGTATAVTYTNSLQQANGSAPVLARYLTTDLSIHWADPLHITRDNSCLSGPPLAAPCLNSYGGPVPAVVHLHGAEVLSQFDGHPDTWFTPGLGLRGPAFVSNVYSYPNTQEATTLWFHDHALGRTRLSVYSGLAGFYLIRDTRDTGMANNLIGLPAGAFENELMIADRQFDRNGQLFFPNGLPGNPTGINGPPPNPDHHPFWNPEFFGDVITVNGKSWPFMSVQPRRYRFRIVNASNARFYDVQLLRTTNQAPGPAIWQIGSDGGFLGAPAMLDNPAVATSPHLFLAPGERADVIIDFAGQATRAFNLVNTANGPFPSGDPPDPNTSGQIMQFRVDQPLVGADATYNPAAPAGVLLRGAPMVNIRPTTPDRRRQLVMVEVEGAGGPEGVLLNNSAWDGNREGAATPTVIPGGVSNGSGISATENPQVGSTEIWEIANLTEDAHPIHLHLVQFQVINRQDMVLDATSGDTTYRAAWDALFPGGTFNGIAYAAGTFIPGYGPPSNYVTPNAQGALGGNLAFTAGFLVPGAGLTLPGPYEAGWKDTVKMLPKTVTRIAVRFAPQGTALGTVAPGMNAFSFDPSAAGPGYVWHCHILDHEDNQMMRPYLVAR
jgi:spore coat protein A